MNYYKCFIDSTYYVMYLHKIQYLLDRFATYISDITVRYLLTYVTYVPYSIISLFLQMYNVCSIICWEDMKNVCIYKFY